MNTGGPIEKIGPTLEPWHILAHLSNMLEDAPAGPARELAAMELVQVAAIVIRNLHGQRSRNECYARLDGARRLVTVAMRGAA